MNTPTAMIHGPSEEIPSTGAWALMGIVVSIKDTNNATAHSNAITIQRRVDTETSLQRWIATTLTTGTIVSTKTSRLIGLSMMRASSGWVSDWPRWMIGIRM